MGIFDAIRGLIGQFVPEGFEDEVNGYVDDVEQATDEAVSEGLDSAEAQAENL